MMEAPLGADDHVAGAVRGPRLPRGVAGAVSVVATIWAVTVCLHETPTAADSFCGTCRAVARASLYGEVVWAIGVSVASAVVARFVSPVEFRVARSAAAVAVVAWVVSVGFVCGWW